MEFEFYNEEGTGLGPTLEYFSLIANELKNNNYYLWRKTDDDSLFPAPINILKLKVN